MKNLCRIIFILPFSLTTCTNGGVNTDIQEHNEENVHAKTLVLEDTISIQLNNRNNYGGVFKSVTIDGIEYLGILNKDYNTYTLYGLESCMPYKAIEFKRNGPNGIGQARFVLLYNWDSIFTTRYHTNQLFMLDSSAKVKQKWELENTVSGKTIHHISASFYFQFEFLNNQIYCKNISIAKVFTDEFWNTDLGLRYDIKEQQLCNNSGSFPQVYKRGINYGSWNYHAFRILTKHEQEVYGFSLDNKLYIYNNTALVKTVSLHSSHVKNDAPEPDKTLTGYNSQEEWMYEIQRNSYRWMFYDKRRDIIYRLVVHAMDPYDAEGNKNKFWDKPFSIQIIDSTFSLIGEIDFPGKQFDFRNIIPSKDGLLISLCHDDNPILEEDKLKLALFKLVKTDEQKN